MRPADRNVFKNCAAQLNLWIIVRRTNPESLQYVGVEGFVPKRIDCKAKTADIGPQAGLVVSPELLPGAYTREKKAKALKSWEDFGEVLQNSLGGYSVDTRPDSPRFGCLLLDGKCIHGDYDIYDIIIPEHARRNLRAVESLLGQSHMRGPRFFQVRDFINQAIGSPMVQHGGEFQYTDHSEQLLDVFGPGPSDERLINGEAAAYLWYRDRFDDRQPPFRRTT